MLHLETDDVPKRDAPRRPEVAERDAHTAVGDVDVEVRQRDERGDEHDHDRCGREEQRVVRPRKDHREDGDPDDEDHREHEQSHESVVEMLFLVEAAHVPFHTGLRRSMKAFTPSRKSVLV